MKRLWLNLTIFFHAFFRGLKQADVEMTGDKGSSKDNMGGIEKHDEVNNVYTDMLKGEVTQEVKEFRHEMYFSERLSHKYKYAGNGFAKKNDMFDCSIPLEKSDGYPIQIVQENKEEVETLGDAGITVYGENVDISERAKGDLRLKDKRDYTVKVTRDFAPKFRIEEFSNKVVVKKVDEEHAIVDFYSSLYPSQFNRRHRPFINEMEKIYEGDLRNEIVDIKTINFISYNAYGSDDLMEYEYDDISFDNLIKFDGNYVIRFYCHIVKDGFDLLSEFYDETAAKKSENHEARNENATIEFDVALAKVEGDNYDAETAKELMKELNGSSN